MKGDRGLSCSKNDKTHYKRTIKVVFITCYKSSLQIMYTAVKKSLMLTKVAFIWSFPVAQMVEHGASNAKIMGSIPRESKS